MAKNKTSVWSVIILIATIVSLVLFVAGIVTLAVSLPATRDAAVQAGIDSGVTEAEAQALGLAAVVVAVVIFALVSVLDILKIIGGFMFSLKGRWGIFCIIVSILGLVGAVVSLVNDITNHAGAGSFVVDSLSLVVDLLLVVACIMHKKEIA